FCSQVCRISSTDSFAGGGRMFSRLFSWMTCPLLLWLSFLAMKADAQQTDEKPAYSESVASDVANLRNQAGRGDAMAEYRLGWLYMTGTEVSLNYMEAAKYLQAAAYQGLSDAEFLVAYLYEHALGVPRDYGKALGYYAAAARMGNLASANNLADM